MRGAFTCCRASARQHSAKNKAQIKLSAKSKTSGALILPIADFPSPMAVI
jgi:hypothetical protein